MWKLGVTVGLTILASAVAILLVAIPEAMAGDLVTNSGELIANADELTKSADILDGALEDIIKQAKEAQAGGEEVDFVEIMDIVNDTKERSELLRQIAENPDDQSIIELGVSEARKAEATVEELRGIRDGVAESASEAAGAAGDASGIPGVSIDMTAGEVQVEVDFKGNLQISRSTAISRARAALEKAGQSADIQITGGDLDEANAKLRMTFKFAPK